MTMQQKQMKKGSWQPYVGDELSWSQMLESFPNKGYLNDVLWSKHLSNLGWRCCRWEFLKSEKSKAYCQSFLKLYPFKIGVLLIPDGIVGDYEFIRTLQDDIRRNLNLHFCYIRIHDCQSFNVDDHLKILVAGWTKPSKSFGGAPLTMILDISGSIEQVRGRLSQNWRRVLKKSSNVPCNIVEIKDPTAVADLYLELKTSKSLKSSQIFSERIITSLMQVFEGKLIVLGAMDLEGNLVAIRGAICRNGFATDTFAATNSAGRSLSASHAVLMALIERCQEQGCSTYDLNGIDPANSLGVYNFKKGTGAEAKASLGQFEQSNSKVLKYAINFLSMYR